MAGSKSVVLAALFANGAIAVLKFLGFLVTGSPRCSRRPTTPSLTPAIRCSCSSGCATASGRDALAPFGYGKAQFFYSFLVSVMLFGIAGWESAKHGYDALTGHGRVLTQQAELLGYQFPGVWVNYSVLLSAVAFRVLRVREGLRGDETPDERARLGSFRQAFRRTSDTTTLTALTEDTVALLGLLLALAGIFLTEQTGNPAYDAAAALAIGVLLMFFAVALAWENKRLLLGESLAEDEENELRSVVENFEGVDSVVGLRTVFFGPNDIVVTADVEFVHGPETREMEATISGLRDALKSANSSITKVYVEPEDGS